LSLHSGGKRRPLLGREPQLTTAVSESMGLAGVGSDIPRAMGPKQIGGNAIRAEVWPTNGTSLRVKVSSMSCGFAGKQAFSGKANPRVNP
jgi:hypothetical protein